MVDNKKNDGTSDEFEDINFDDFSDADLDEAQLEEEMAADDIADDDFSDDNFADDDWQDDDSDDLTQGDPSLIKQGDAKGGLSFNTIVMIGAFVLGAGVLAMNVMVKSNEKTGETSSIFRSMLNIGGVMDGDLLGAKEKTKTAEEIAAQESQTQNEGFLNNPGVLVPSDQPPQPVPIAPPEEAATDNQPLTPMPGMAQPAPGVPAGDLPRGPEEGVPENNVAIAELPADAQTPPASTLLETPTTTPSAEDILKEAMLNREQKEAALEEAPPAPADAAPVTPEQPVEEEPAPVETIAEMPAPAKTPEPAAPVTESGESSASSEALAENTKAVEALDQRLDTLLQRMDQIESELGNVKDSAKPADTSGLEQTIESLKGEIAALKNRPAPAASEPAPKPRKPVPLEEPGADEPEDEVAEAPKPAPVKKASKPKPVTKASSSASSSRWELRAAQPGRAWVSKPGERDMQSVEIGQSLPGIGRVTGIIYQGGRWTVQGTSGQINQ